MRNIKYIVIHCTASSTKWNANDVVSYFRDVRKWRVCGYHYIIERDGKVVNTVRECDVSNGVRGYNRYCINIAYIGGIDAHGNSVDNRTQEQKESLRRTVALLRDRYPLARIMGHRDFPNVAKDCPCFDVATEL